MINCSKCGNGIPESDLTAHKALSSKDGRTFCAKCTAAILAQQKAAKAKAAAQGAPAPRQAPSKATARATTTSETDAYYDEEQPAQQAPKEKSFYEQYGKWFYIAGAIIIALVLYKVISNEYSEIDKTKLESDTIQNTWYQAKEAIRIANEATYPDYNKLAPMLKTAQEKVKAYADYAASIDKSDAIAGEMKSFEAGLVALQKEVNELKAKDDTAQAMLAQIETLKVKINNPDEIVAAMAAVDEMRQKGKELIMDKSFFDKLDELVKLGREPVVTKLMGDAAKAPAGDFNAARDKYAAALSKARELDRLKEKDGERSPTDPENKYITEILDTLKQMGRTKDKADNPHDVWLNLLDAKYAKLWKQTGNGLTVERASDGSVTFVNEKKDGAETCIYYIGDEYAWEDVSLDVRYIIVGIRGFHFTGRYNPDQLAFGNAWDFKLTTNKFSPDVQNTLTLTARAGYLTLACSDPQEMDGTKIDISKPGDAKMGGIGLNFDPGCKIIFLELKAKLNPR